MNKELQIVLENGLNELYLTQQKECILTAITNLPNLTSLSVFSFIFSDNSSNGKLISQTLNLLRRILPLLPSDYDYSQFYLQINAISINDVDFNHFIFLSIF